MDIQEEVSIRELILDRETHIDFYHEVRQGVTSRRDAIDELESILDEITDDFRRAIALDLLGKREEAKGFLRNCQGNAMCVHLLGKLSLEEGNSKEALVVLETGWANFGSVVPRIGMLLCEAMIHEHRIDEARALLSKLPDSVDHPRICYLEGLLHQHEGDYDEALQFYSTAAESKKLVLLSVSF